MPTDLPSQESTFADKLDHLFRTITAPDGKEYTHRDVMAGTNGTVTAVYVWKLRAGKKTNPGYKVIAALSHFFKVDPTYFFEPIDPESSKILIPSDAAKHQLNEDVIDIALRVSELDEEGQHSMSDLIDYIRKVNHEKNDKADK